MAPFAPGNPQLHDINPGDLNTPGEPQWFANGGLFWTMPIARREIAQRARRGDVWFHSPRLLMRDFIDFPNSVFRNDNGTPKIDSPGAVASVTVIWKGKGPRQRISAEATEHSAPFVARFRAADILMAWKAATLDGYWVSVNSKADENVSINHAFTAQVRNGVFV